MGWYGPQGYQPFATRAPPELKPGETHTKFRTCPDQQPIELRDATISSMASSALRASHYKRPDRRGVSASFAYSAHEPKPCSDLTMSRVSYVWPHGGAKRASKPEWLRTDSNDGPHARHLRSSYQRDIGKAGDLPTNRPFLYKNGMASTTLELCRGTPKATYHIPGYSGHAPLAADPTSNAALQADGAHVRPAHSDLRLFHNHNVPGYTGHDPKNAFNDRGPRLSGANPKTTSGAMVLGEVL